MWALSVPQPFSAPLLAGAGGYFAPHHPGVHRPLGRARATSGMMVAVKDRLHALEEPVRAPAPARHHDPDGRGVAMLWDPLHCLESCPSSDGAARW